MKKVFVLLTGLVFILAACKSQKGSSSSGSSSEGAPNTLSGAEKKDGWKLLFDGKTKNGWHSYGSNVAGDAWQAVDGALYYDTSQRDGRRMRGGGDLVTNQEFENFDFKYEWKIAPKGNSGIIFLINEDTARYKQTYYTGLEMQVLDNEGHPDGKITKHRSGDLYDLVKSTSEPVKPVGEWNQAEIKMNNGKLELYLNGINVVSTTLWDDNWNQMVANSKFKAMPGFSKYKKGKLSLQDHGNPVWFRNIKIKEI